MSVKSRHLFEDLGKATLRGVRKCPKCGVYNGTRGLSCKNKECKLVFRKAKKKSAADAVKVVSSSPLQIYSVKLQETEDDQRTFVHLPTIEGIEALQDEEEVVAIKRSAATCYAPSCIKPVTTEDVTALQLNLFPCAHTAPVASCTLDAQPLPLEEAALEALCAPQPRKAQLAAVRLDAAEHLVQRVTKNTFVVKCEPDALHPLGYLHFALYEQKKRFRILCGCQTQLSRPVVPREKQMCVHFYLCVCALASDPKLSVEFKQLLQTMMSSPPSDDLVESNPDTSELREFFVEGDSLSVKKKKNTSIGSNQSFLLQENNLMKNEKKEEITLSSISMSNEASEVASISFDQWLASVTERINQTMHYQFSGNPDPLVFQVPQVFFDVLQQRLSAGSKKKRLPNSVVGFSVKDSLPMGVFSKYTWQITNIFHVKRIFDTPQVPLEITRSFMQNRDGTYLPYQPLNDEEKDLAQNYRKTLNNLLIKPLELKTFLKVGNMTSDQKQPIPFTVEWIPDILPKTQVGELRIKFEYGHQRNGVIEHRPNPPDSEEDIIIPD